MIIPPFPTLFPKSPLEFPRNETPLLLSILFNEFDYFGIFFGGPWSFDETGFENFLPSVEALDVCSVGEDYGYFFPVSSVIGVDCYAECFIFC